MATGGSPVLANAKVFSVDKNGNPVSTREYDWMPYSVILHGGSDSSLAPKSFTISSALLRTTNNTFNALTPTAGNADTPSAYWNPGSPRVWNQLASSSVSGTGPTAQASFSYGDDSGHPNLKLEQHWDSATGTWLTTNYTYDAFGNRTSMRDSRQHTTTYAYDASNCMYQRVQAADSAVPRSFRLTCDPQRGLITAETDSDHAIMRSFDYDRFGRNSLVTESGGTLSRKTKTTYSDSLRKITVASDLNSSGDGALVNTTWYDQLGRVRQTKGPSGSTAQMRYYTPPPGNSAAGLTYHVVSNPYFNQGDPTMGWTRTVLDQSGRSKEVQHYSEAELPAPGERI